MTYSEAWSFHRLSIILVLAALLVACSGEGENASAPPPNGLQPPPTASGDTENYFPIRSGDSWTYNVLKDGPSFRRDLSTVSISGSKSVHNQLSTVFTERFYSDPPAAVADEWYNTKSPTDVVFFGSSIATDTLTAGLVPYTELLFPIAIGPITTFTRTGVDVGSDRYGNRQIVDLRQTTSITAFESITVPAGTFPAAARQVITRSGAGALNGSGDMIFMNSTEISWFAPGAGLIKRESSEIVQGPSRLDYPIVSRAFIEARGFSVGGVRKGMGNPQQIFAPDVGLLLTQTPIGDAPETVDTPAVASSGASFLLLGKQYSVGPNGKWTLRRVGTFRMPDGSMGPGAQVDVGPPVLSNDTREIQLLAYGDGTYLAVFEQRNVNGANSAGPTEPSIVVQRIGLAGNLIDAMPVVLVPQGPAPATPDSSSRLPQVTFGGGTFLVIYCGGPATSSTTYIEGRLVAPDGTVSVPFRISPDFVYAGATPRVVFDGTNFIVAVGDASGWRLTRVTPAGAVLDPIGVGAQALAGPVQLATSGQGGALLTWISSDVVYARRFAADLSALEGSPVRAADAYGARSPLAASFVGGEYVIGWAQQIGQRLVLYTTRIAAEGTVLGQTAPRDAPTGGGPFAALTSPWPVVPASGYVGGFALPAFGVGNDVALLAYVSGSSNGPTVAERAASVEGIWVHPFARSGTEEVRRP